MEHYFETMRQPAFSMIGLIVAWRVFDFVFPPLFPPPQLTIDEHFPAEKY